MIGAIKTEFPPLELSSPVVYMLRGYGEDYVVVFVAGGDSFELTIDNLLTWLLMKGWNGEDAQNLTSYLWNFYGVKVDMDAQRFDWRSTEDVINAVGAG